MPRCIRGAILLFVLISAASIGSIDPNRCWGDESKSPQPPANAASSPAVLSGAVSSHPAPVRQISFDELALAAKRRDLLAPPQVTVKARQLEGKTVRIRGFILPTHQGRGITQFVLGASPPDHHFDLLELVQLA